MQPSIILIAIDGPIARPDIPALCDRVRARLDDAGPAAVVCDVRALTSPDAAAVDALARLLLLCRRLGLDVRFSGASAELVELVTLAGLLGILPLNGRSGVKAWRQPEQRKEGGGVQEEGDPGDSVC
jgi:ABC-type transporter Mla MlaB component